MKKKHKKWLLLILAYMLFPVAKMLQYIPDSTFEVSGTRTFNRLVVDEIHNKIYIGGVNKIYQLSTDLKIETVVKMGPQMDSPKCPASRKCPGVKKHPTNYYNKILVLDNSINKLIACGNLFQGACTIHDFKNVSYFRTPSTMPVVTNTTTASSVALIAPGPHLKRQVMYVGVSYSRDGPYQSELPLISSRSLNPRKMFEITHPRTMITLNSMSRSIYPITYVYGFSKYGFSHFLTVQQFSLNHPMHFVSKIVRVCQNDVNYSSYAEMQLICNVDGVDYNLVQAAHVGKPGFNLAKSLEISDEDSVLFAIFAKSSDDTEFYNEHSSNSALCLYALPHINRQFAINVKTCADGRGWTGLDYITKSRPCYTTSLKKEDEICGLQLDSPHDGSIPMTATPVLRFSGTLLTAVAATALNDHTVVFLGTSNGHLKKTVVETQSKAWEYRDLVIDEGSPIKADMFLNKDATHLFVMSERKVTKVRTQGRCHLFESCTDCLGANDPYCGWCSSQNKCSLNSECAEAEYVPLYWLSVTDHCIYLNAVEPQETLKTASQVVSLYFSNLPQLDIKYFCDFKIFEKSYKMDATEVNGVIECPTPPVLLLPNIVQSQHYYTSKLTVTTNIEWNVAMTNFTFYECDSLKTCTDCVSSKFPCNWCINSYTCIDSTEECEKDALIEPISALNPNSVSGPNSCPRILKTGKSTEILIPSGNRNRISVKIDGIKPYMKDKNFLCRFIIEEVVQKVKATLNGDSLSCEEVMFSLSSGNARIYANFSVLYDEDKLIDNPENILVLIYKCSEMAQNCALCLELPEKYGCGWCQEDKESCQVHEHCNYTLMNLWLDQDYICPNPQIIRFHPKSGPWEGGTNITINGINLGRHYYDIESNVQIVQGNGKEIAKCTTYEELYVKSTQIVCKVEKPLNFTYGKTELPLDGFIEVGVLREYFARTKEQYSFVSSRIINVIPTKGPKSGGTILNIVGLHMDTGSKAKVFIGKQLCIVYSRDSGKITCISPASKETNRQTIAVQFDSGTRISYSQKFEYVEDPMVIAVESSSSGQKDIPKGIPSGGIKITVKGKNFHAVPSHHIYIVVGELEFNHTCELLSGAEILCPSPMVPIEKLNFVKDGTNTLPIQLDYGFRMDNVESVTNLSNRPGFSKFFMYPDPVVYTISENNGIIQYRGENLVIEGNNLNYIFQVSDIIVHIGTGYCNMTSLTPSRITCKPQNAISADKNANSDLYENELLEIVVEIGDRLNYTIGKMKYSSKKTFTLGNPVLIGVASSLVILILLILIILLYCYWKRMKNKESFIIHLENASKRLENPPDVWRKNLYGDEDAPQFVPARKYVRPKVNKIMT